MPFQGQPCTPPGSSGNPDSCAADDAGLFCRIAPDGGFNCLLPDQFQSCLPTPGCSADLPGLVCEDIPAFGGQICVAPCNSTAQCPGDATVCVDSAGVYFCAYDFCGAASAVGDGGPTNGTTFYAPCNNVGIDDGFCLPWSFGSLTLGLCFASGPLTAGDTGCAENRAGGSGMLCQPGLSCVQSSSDLGTICAPICGGPTKAADGGPGCPSTQACYDLEEPFGACFTPCTNPNQCAGGLSCEALSGGGGICLP